MTMETTGKVEKVRGMNASLTDERRARVIS